MHKIIGKRKDPHLNSMRNQGAANAKDDFEAMLDPYFGHELGQLTQAFIVNNHSNDNYYAICYEYSYHFNFWLALGAATVFIDTKPFFAPKCYSDPHY